MRIRANVIATAFVLASLAALSILQSACGGGGYGGGGGATAPSITAQPQNTTVTAGQTATFSVTATGTAPLSYQWQKNNANIGAATQSSYTTPATTTADNAATFLVVVSNSAGSINSNSATLTVNSSGGGGNGPTMTIQPQNQVLNAGQTATFTVGATGTGTLSYQWYGGATAIGGATSASYTTPSLSVGNSTYYATITDSTGTTTSATASATALNPAAPINVLTYHNDIARTGQNLNETILTKTNVNSSGFGKVGFMTVTGLVDAEPLYVSGLSIAGGTHNVVFVATENDLVYAFDADNFAQLWGPISVTAGDTYSDNRGCDQVTPNIGVTSTPVIDLSAGTHGAMFLVAMTKDSGGNYHHKLHELDISTGAEMAGSPVEITATFTLGGTHTTFTPSQYKERAALLLLNGQIYLGFSSHCDAQPYQGWMMAYSESSLQQTAVLNVTPNGSEGAIWMAGDGLAADSAGNIYFLDANGTFDTTLTNGFPSQGDYGNAFVKVSTAGNSLAVADYFNMKGTVHESQTDEDLGSGGDLLLPDMNDLPGNARHLAVGAGKDSIIYVVDRDSMGKFNSSQDNIYQEVKSSISGGVWSMPAYYNDTVYYASVGDALKAFSIVNGLLVAPPGSQSSATYSYPGGIPSISANGNTNGIVWVVQNASGGVLHAYDATNLSNELYNSTQGSGGAFADNKYITPMIANGKVYVGTPTGVIVFGLK